MWPDKNRSVLTATGGATIPTIYYSCTGIYDNVYTQYDRVVRGVRFRTATESGHVKPNDRPEPRGTLAFGPEAGRAQKRSVRGFTTAISIKTRLHTTGHAVKSAAEFLALLPDSRRVPGIRSRFGPRPRSRLPCKTNTASPLIVFRLGGVNFVYRCTMFFVWATLSRGKKRRQI